MVDPTRFITSAPVPLAIVRAGEEVVQVANQAFAEIVGRPLGQVIGRPLAEMFADPEAVRERLADLRAGDQATLAGPLPRSDGDTVILTTWRIPEAGGSGAAAADVGVLATSGDEVGPDEPGGRLTETLREVNEALLIAALQEQAQAEEARSESEAKSVFLASVSHELRTPLNSIIGYSDLLDAGVPAPLPEGLESHVGRIRAAAQHLLALIEQIIEASRAEFDERVDAEVFDVAALVPEVVDLVGGRAREAGIRLEVSAGEPLEVESDRRKVRQILLNLLVNAIKFTPEGRVRVEVDHTDDTFGLRVSDTGVGIEPDVQDRIFRRFWQAGGTPVRTNGGMGIGLWVVRTLVDALGGSISLDSEPGAGSTFEVTLPRRQ